MTKFQTRDELSAEIARIVRATFNAADATVNDATIAADIDGWDSLSHTILIMEIERALSIELPMDRVFGFANVGELIDAVWSMVGVQAA